MTETAPYQQIAAEISRRIKAGKLKPGDRVPSTRALVREFDVAMATATKALTSLQQEGLVHARAGVGTVVGPQPGQVRALRPAVEAPTLSKEEVVRTAIAIADAEGLAALSMRRIASDLGVSTMALYRYVGGKEALVLQMVDTCIGEFPLPAGRPAGWRESIETAARLQWSAYRRHLWLAGAINMSRPQLLPNLLPHTDVVLRALAGFGIDGSTSLFAAITVFGYVRGVALSLEPEAQAEQDTGLTADEWADQQAERMAALIEAEDLSGFRALELQGGFDFDLDAVFDFGLALVLDGLAARLRKTT
ncbi:MAG TPA: GntR family transcriptional regulator [Kribbella sp.]|uniref:GntR family transcriptional regulator n=1 Tax=Kribbella sp. TaxID=1871183 RepID=UPI002D769853|nr:GntR family transcriptional regulator [Kribbella sp.]HET6295044.1 GntR family transcriptional regulator [Kribbella sp.]